LLAVFAVKGGDENQRDSEDDECDVSTPFIEVPCIAEDYLANAKNQQSESSETVGAMGHEQSKQDH
jgi:hypothetical protein